MLGISFTATSHHHQQRDWGIVLNRLEEEWNLPLKTLQSTLFDSEFSEIYIVLQLLLKYLSCSSELSPLLYLCTSNWKEKCAPENINQTWMLYRILIKQLVIIIGAPKKLQFIAYLYMLDISIPMNIKLTGIQTRISFQLSFSTETARQRPNTTTTRELIRFCLKLYEK
jgi:hypothetical protein